MKRCFSTLVCPAWSLQQIIDSAAANGMQGIDFRGVAEEIDITRLPAFSDELDQTLARLRERGLEMPCLNTSIILVSPAQERWQMMLEECQRHVQLAMRTGTRFLRVFGGAVPRGMTRAEARAMSQRRLRQLSKICRGSGCQILLETHDDWSTSQQALELLHEFAPDEAAALWDVEHSYRNGESPADTVSKLRPYIKHVHIKDSRREHEARVPMLLGEGELPLTECLHVLRETGYDDWICLETEKRWASEAPDPEASVPQFAAFLRQHWPAAGR
jgi:sugar phosphate isomerase/epimerase